MALNAKPNRAHLALAELARRNPDFITLSQNVDGLSPRAHHPPEQLKLLHGNLFDVKCWDEFKCGYFRANDFTDPIVPALAIPEDQSAAAATLGKAKLSSSEAGGDIPTASASKKHALVKGANIADIDVPLPDVKREDLPQCPKCQKNPLRPGVVWFGESLPEEVVHSVGEWFDAPERIDLMLVIGTSSQVYPAAGYTEMARQRGARVAVINMDRSDAKNLSSRDWFFEGDAAMIVPDILKSVIGEIEEFKES